MCVACRGREYFLLPATALVFSGWYTLERSQNGTFYTIKTKLQMEYNLSEIFGQFGNYQINLKN